MLYILNFFYGITHSYGFSIILLTVLVRILLHPLNHKQLVSMQKMQKLQPRLKVLQEKYANDKEQLNKETMQLYKENKVNPAAGCLPLLVQLPILILLFRVLNNQELLNQTLMLTQESLSFFTIHLDQSLYGAMGAAFGLGGGGDHHRACPNCSGGDGKPRRTCQRGGLSGKPSSCRGYRVPHLVPAADDRRHQSVYAVHELVYAPVPGLYLSQPSRGGASLLGSLFAHGSGSAVAYQNENHGGDAGEACTAPGTAQKILTLGAPMLLR